MVGKIIDFYNNIRYRIPYEYLFLVNGVPLAWLLIHLMMEPIADNPKEERR